MTGLILQFPPNVAECYNATDCGDRGACTLLAKDGTLRCLCPRFYDALTRCETTYDASVSDAFLVPTFLVAVLYHLLMIALVAVRWWREMRRCKCCMVPRLKLIVMSSIIFLSASSIVVATLQMARRTPDATFINVIVTALFALAYDIILYFYFVLMIRSKNLGELTTKWRIVSRLVIGLGLVGVGISLPLGVAREIAPIAVSPYVWAITMGVVVGVGIPSLVTLGCAIYTLTWVSRRDYTTTRSWNVYWHGTWMIIVTIGVMLLNLVANTAAAALTSDQLNDTVSFRRIVVTVGVMSGATALVVFVRITEKKKGDTTPLDTASTEHKKPQSTTTTTTQELHIADDEAESAVVAM
jgi:hypothetical protein